MLIPTSLTTLVRLLPAQFGSGAVTKLPGAPLIERLTLENPWALITFLVIAAAVTWIVLNRAGKQLRAFQAAAGLVLLAVGFWVLAAQVTTDRETTKLRTRQFVQAVAKADVQGVEEVLAPDARLYKVVGGDDGVPLDVILSQLHNFRPGATYEIGQAAILDLQSTIDGPKVARTQVRVRVTPVNGGPVFAWFKLDWRRLPDGSWQAKGIELLWSSWTDG